MRQVTLDDETFEMAERLAALRNGTVQEVVSDAVRRGYREDPRSVIGALEADAELLDRIVADAMRERDTRPLRSKDG